MFNIILKISSRLCCESESKVAIMFPLACLNPICETVPFVYYRYLSLTRIFNSVE